jgi:hypothetical protein
LDQSIFYVDIENLQDIDKQAISVAIRDWPEGFPKPAIIKLYVKADQTELWRIWASHNIPDIEVDVKGVQHYTLNGSKNSADISLSLDALTDVLKSRTKHIAIMSDDSDYVSLYMALKQEIGATENPKTIFMWFMTNRSGTRSQMLNDFFPSEYIQTVVCSSPTVVPKEPKSNPSTSPPIKKTPASPKPKKTNSIVNDVSDVETIAKTIIKNIKVGSFKSTDCQKIIKQYFPQNLLGKANSAAFGTQFSKDIWPTLEKYGVALPNPSRKPRKYEMTEEAKNKVG